MNSKLACVALAGAIFAGCDGGSGASACATPNAEARMTHAAPLVYPRSAKDLGLGAVTAVVEVTVGPSGNFINATMYRTSYNMAIDQAALRAARRSTYSPKVENCQPITGDYTFIANFQP